MLRADSAFFEFKRAQCWMTAMKSSLIILSLFLISAAADAQERQFPYQAQVTADEAYVRSGGGENFYPTRSLKRGSVITVLRHDPGGWYMIEPPQGSFSWIKAKYVQPASGGTAEVIEGEAVVFVGSSFGDETSVWQRKLRAGEKVSIIGQKVVDTHAGPIEMYKIVPPDREFRWIPGASIIPTDENVRQANDRNPYKVPTAIAERGPSNPQPAASAATAPPETNQPRYLQSESLARLKKIREDQRALQQLDQEFRYMILSHPSEWDLDKLERNYLDLQQQVTHKPVAGQIDLRYPAIYRYRQRKAQLDEFQRLTSQTEQRDAQLMAAQFGLPSPTIQNTPPLASNVPPQLAGTTFGPTVASSGSAMPVPDSGFDSSIIASNGPVGSNGSFELPENSKYIGAGYLQRDVTGKANEFVLTTEAGKVLARLTPEESVNLEQFVGQSVGLQGKRWFDPEVKTDRIEVSNLERVRIRN